MPPLNNLDLRAVQVILEWMMVGVLLPLGLFSIGDDWRTGLSYIALAIILYPLTAGTRWLKLTIALIVILIGEL